VVWGFGSWRQARPGPHARVSARRRGRAADCPAPVVEPVRPGEPGERASPVSRAEPANGGGEQRSRVSGEHAAATKAPGAAGPSCPRQQPVAPYPHAARAALPGLRWASERS